MSSTDQAHEDALHDAQLDYYGNRLASCSSDFSIKIWAVLPINSSGQQQHKLTATLRGHEGPVWQVAWAHPKFGSPLASCAYDHKVIVWAETTPNQWIQSYVNRDHGSSVNAIAWAPHEVGLVLASASSDGQVGVMTYDAERKVWGSVKFDAHQIGCNTISWAPTTATEGPASKVLASGGCDNQVNIWRFVEEPIPQWDNDATLTGHSDWVRDVAFSPVATSNGKFTLATGAQDRNVILWRQDESDPKTWNKLQSISMNDVVWRLSWDPTGSTLAVTTGDNKVTLLKEDMATNEWKAVSTIDILAP